jgi:predicted phosphodiesterase
VRLLCLSDIHGHASALHAILATADKRGYQKLLVAGDLCFPGPEPLETWRTLARLNAMCVQGVADKALATFDLATLQEAATDPQRRAMLQRFQDVRAEIGDLVLERLRRLPTEVRMPLPDGRELLLVHGSPEDPTEPMTHDLDDDELRALIGDDPADIIVCGMSHVPFERVVADVHIINVGSVGESPSGGVAHGAILDIGAAGVTVEMLSVPLGD